MPQKRERSCFIIGPMRDAHLKQNARRVRILRYDPDAPGDLLWRRDAGLG